MEFIASVSSALLDLSMQHVSIQQYCKPSALARSPQKRIFPKPALPSPTPSMRSLKVTSSLPVQVCDRIPYGGEFSPKSWGRCSGQLYCIPRGAFCELWDSSESLERQRHCCDGGINRLINAKLDFA